MIIFAREAAEQDPRLLQSARANTAERATVPVEQSCNQELYDQTTVVSCQFQIFEAYGAVII